MIKKIKMKYSRAFWIDNNYKKYKVKDIKDDHLKEIIYDIAEGIRFNFLIRNKKRLNRVFKEAYNRKLVNFAGLLNLHQWSLCRYGFSDSWPRYLFTRDNQIFDMTKGAYINDCSNGN